MRGFQTLVRAVDAVVYPDHCLLTSNPITGPTPLPHISREGLDQSAPAPDTVELLLTAQRRISADDIAFSNVYALWSLEPDAPIHNAIVAIKYRGMRRLAVAFGEHLGHVLCDIHGVTYTDTNAHTVVSYVPVHRTRRRERGYDQAQEIARGVAAAMKVPLYTLLERTRYTGTQTMLSDIERSRNVCGAFRAINVETIAGTRIILVDDVFTTGATLNNAAMELLEAGARRVDCAVLCATV